MASSGINPTNSNGIYARAEETAYVAAEQLHRVFNGTAEEEVMADDGLIPSVRKALVDNFYFLDPIGWEVDVTESVFNQPRVFTNPTAPEDVTYWFAPAATSKSLIPMGGSPFGDDNWQPWINGFDKGNPLISWAYTAETIGQTVINVPFKFKVVGNVFINGVHQNPDEAYEYNKKKRTVTLSQALDLGDTIVIQFGMHGGVVPSLISQLEKLRDEVKEDADRAEISADRAEVAAENAATETADEFSQQFQDRFNTLAPIPWVAGLKVTNALQVYSHVDGQGVERSYLPDPKLVPFTTGDTFNTSNWVLSGLMTQMKHWRDVGDARGWGIKPSNPDNSLLMRVAMSEIANRGGGDLVVQAGIYVFKTVTNRVYTSPNIGKFTQAFMFAESNVTIRAIGAVIFRAADGLERASAALFQCRGFQFFVNEDFTKPLPQKFFIIGVTFDYNGQNNLISPPNSTGHQCLMNSWFCAAIDSGMLFCKHINHAGQQCIYDHNESVNSRFLFNEFYDAGWMNGLNANLVDHSTIYSSGDSYEVANNKLKQSALSRSTTALENHGSGKLHDNELTNYSANYIVAALTKNADVTVTNDKVRGGKFYCAFDDDNVYDTKARFINNDVELSKNAIIPNVINNKKYGHIFYAGESQHDVGTNNYNDILIQGGSYKYTGGEHGTVDDFNYRKFAVLQGVHKFIVKDTEIDGVSGNLVELQRMPINSLVRFKNNDISNCGYTGFNKIFEYTNANDNRYGNRLLNLELFDNSYNNCAYDTYLDVETVAINTIAPRNITIFNDSSARWLRPYTGVDLTASDDRAGTYVFNYNCFGTVTASLPLPPQSSEVVKSSNFNIRAEISDGQEIQFVGQKGYGKINAVMNKFTESPPVNARIFGDIQGDRYTVINPGITTEWVCTASGVNGGFGEWKPVKGV